MNTRVACLLLMASATIWFGADANAQTLVSAGKTATASNYTGTQYPSFVTDGLYGQDQHWSAGAYAPQWIKVDLEQAFAVSSITVIGPLTASFYNYTVQFDVKGSQDDSNWTLLGSATLYDNTDMNLRSETFSLGGDFYRYIRLDYTGGTHHSSAAEIQVYAVPEPAATALIGGGVVLAFLLVRRGFRRS